MPQFMGGVGAYEILLSKPNEAPHDCYRRIWPIMVLENTCEYSILSTFNNSLESA